MYYFYVLELEDDCWYCGQTQDPVKRMHDHALGSGSAWCKQHKPLVPVAEHFTKWEIPDMGERERDDLEDMLCETLQTKYGLNKARGGYLVCCGKLTARPPREKARAFYLRLIAP